MLALAIASAIGGCRADRSAEVENTGHLRVVSLTPSSTEIVAAVGGVELLVAVDEFSKHPPQVASLPRVGSFLTPNFEAILRLRPDIVVLDRVQQKIGNRLARVGIRTVILEMHTIADIRAGVVAIGEAVNAPDRADAIIAELDRTVEAVSTRAAKRTTAERPKVLVLVDRAPGSFRSMVAAGPGSYLDELLALTGAANMIIDSPVRYARISKEQILRGKPTVILDASSAENQTDARKVWSAMPSIPAVQTNRVFVLGDRFYLAPGPRVGDALLGLEELIYGISAP